MQKLVTLTGEKAQPTSQQKYSEFLDLLQNVRAKGKEKYTKKERFGAQIQRVIASAQSKFQEM